MKHKNSAKHRLGFFSKILLLSTCLLMIFAVVSCTFILRISNQSAKDQYLKNYDLASMNLLESYGYHYSNFNILAGKFLTGNTLNTDILTLLQEDTADNLSIDKRSRLIDLFSSVCGEERYLNGIIIYSTETNTLYSYIKGNSVLHFSEKIDTSYNNFNLKPFSGKTIDASQIREMLYLSGISTSSVYYGMTATLFKTPSAPLGYIIPLYSATEYNDILSRFNLDNANFYIEDALGTEIYKHQVSTDADSSWYTASISAVRNSYQVRYEVPPLKFWQPRSNYLILLFAGIITIFSLLLFSLTYYLSNKNIGYILNGMNQFTLDNLNYRIPELSNNDEFTEIIHSFNLMCQELQENVNRSYVYELNQQRSEFYALQTSINPHFLYNTLDIIRAQVLSGQSESAAQMILLLSKIYRSQTDTRAFVPLDRELEICENMISLYQHRFRNFDYEFDADDSIGLYAVPKNTLLPLVENYFSHGIIADKEDNFIQLTTSSQKNNGKLYISLKLGNNGKPIDENTLENLTRKLEKDIYELKSNEGFALTNVMSRMRIVFKEDCRMLISSGDEDMNFQIELIFPAVPVYEMQETFESLS